MDTVDTGYDYMKPPNLFEATEAKIGIYINSFRSIDTKDMSFSLTFYLKQQWTDPRLQYTPSLRDHTSQYVHPDLVKNVWRPDIFMKNEIESHVYDFTTPNQVMMINQNGSVWYVIKVTASLSCPMKLGYYPFDSQRCSIFFESFGYKMDVLYFRWMDDPVSIDPAVHLSQFWLKTKTWYDCSQNYTMAAFTCLFVEFRLHRDIGYFVAQVFFPSILLVVLSWLAFWLRQDTPIAIGLLVLTSLTVLTESVHSSDTIPQVSYVKAIDIWFAVCFGFTFAVLLVVASADWSQYQQQTQEDSHSSRTRVGAHGKNINRLIVWCRVVFPISFLLFITIYFNCYTQLVESQE